MSAVTTHVLDSAAGKPAAGVGVILGQGAEGAVQIADATTDADGRVTELGPDRLEPGTYRLRFDVGSYFSGRGQETFYPEIVVIFTLGDSNQHYHVPLLLSPFSYSTYRGS
ncbi:MAG: hydroxyisourate hydrolase [Nocardioidaceae bacterium]